MIEITVNGQAKQIENPMTINQLLEIIELPGPYLAVEVNENVIPRIQHDEQLVVAGDQIEVVTLVGGG